MYLYVYREGKTARKGLRRKGHEALASRVQSLRVFGARYAAEFSGKARQLGLQTIVEGSVVGMFFAVWWRTSHVAEKARYDKYYAQLRAETAAAAE